MRVCGRWLPAVTARFTFESTRAAFFWEEWNLRLEPATDFDLALRGHPRRRPSCRVVEMRVLARATFTRLVSVTAGSARAWSWIRCESNDVDRGNDSRLFGGDLSGPTFRSEVLADIGAFNDDQPAHLVAARRCLSTRM